MNRLELFFSLLYIKDLILPSAFNTTDDISHFQQRSTPIRPPTNSLASTVKPIRPKMPISPTTFSPTRGVTPEVFVSNIHAWTDELPHPEYFWSLRDGDIWYEGLDGNRQVYFSCLKNPCLTFPKTEPTGYLVFGSSRDGKTGIYYQEGPGTGNHHGKFIELADFDQQKNLSNLRWSQDGRIIRVEFTNGEHSIYQVKGLPIDVGRGKWDGNPNGRIEENVTNGIYFIFIPQ